MCSVISILYFDTLHYVDTLIDSIVANDIVIGKRAVVIFLYFC